VGSSNQTWVEACAGAPQVGDAIDDHPSEAAALAGLRDGRTVASPASWTVKRATSSSKAIVSTEVGGTDRGDDPESGLSRCVTAV